MFHWLRSLVRTARQKVVTILAKYDAAQTTHDNKRHWSNADSLSAKSANSLEVRTRLRNRARYEFDNNGYCQGLILSLADHLVGTGPRLQLLTEDDTVNRAVEVAFHQWVQATGLVDKLHILTQSKKRDGEGFGVLVTNRQLESPVQLDVRLVETDQITTPSGVPPVGAAGWVDGVELDEAGNPVAYHVLRYHPGDTSFANGVSWGEYDRVPARLMLHWYRANRAGQVRGVPEITPSLPLFAQLRRYTLATLTAAETAADFAALLETQAPADGETDDPTPFETLEIERGMMTTLPSGARLAQLKAEQPTTTYPDFKRELLKEIGRPVSAPYNVTAGDSSPYNYSSARMDHLLYRAAIRVERDHCRRNILERIYAAWIDEAVMIPGYLPAGVSAETPHTWYWPGFEAIDPTKEAAADTERLANGTTTLAELLAEYGQDWQAFLVQRGREVEMARQLGLPIPGVQQTQNLTDEEVADDAA